MSISGTPTLVALNTAFKNRALSPKQLRALAQDPRAGAQALWQRHQSGLAAEQAEAARLEGLLSYERPLWQRGQLHVGGCDEVGAGPLFGPVVAAVVVLPPGLVIPGVDDSKKLSAARRESLDREIRAHAVMVSLGQCNAHEIDLLNIYRACREAMRRAVAGCQGPLDHLLVDAHRVPAVAVPQSAVPNGDGVSHTIAAASIVAKVARDRQMLDFEARYPGYGIAQHKGYGTRAHLAALAELGPTPEHRRSFGPVRALCTAPH